MRLLVVIILLAVQIVASLFYASTALAMWGPFMAAPLWAKAVVAVIVTAPVLGFLAAYDRVRIPKTGRLATVGVVTLLQLALVFASGIVSGG